MATAPDHFLPDYPANKFSTFADVLPSRLQGKSVLDIGCNAGFYSLEMKRRGASRVVAIDSDPRYLAQAELVAEVYDADIEFRQMRSEEHTSELQSLMRISYAVFCLKKKNKQ